jgi:hypothetical protein
MKALIAACSLGLAAQIASPALAQQDNGNTFKQIDKAGSVITVLSPLKVDSREGSLVATPLTFNDADFDAIASAERVNMLDFPLDRTTTIDLELEAFEVFAQDAVRVSGTPNGDVPTRTGNIQLFRGSVVGIPNSWVYLAISPTMNNGIVEIEGTTYVVSSGDYVQQTGASIYNMSDLPEGEIDWVEYACTVIDESPQIARGDDGGGIDEQECRLASMAIEADNELSNKFGTDPLIAEEATNMYIESLVGGVSEIYLNTWNMQLEIIYSRIWPGGEVANPDEWEGTNTPAALVELRELWSNSPPITDWNGVHMLSGKALGGGIAYLRAICNQDIAMAVSGNLNGVFPDPLVDNHPQNWDLTVVAHEWGHNFGAPHTHGLTPFVDACGFGDCSQAEFGTIMSYCHTCSGGMENIALTFHDRILSEGIIPYVTGGMLQFCQNSLHTGATDCGASGNSCPADLNGDGELTPADFTAWIVAFNAGDLAADLNRNGTLEAADFTAWLISWQNGCDPK